jgi:dihydroorotase
VPYKLYLSESTAATDESVAGILSTFAGAWLSVHAEDPGVLRMCADAPTHESRRPPAAEVEAVKRLLRCLRENPCLHLHICHISVGETATLIAEAKRAGLPVSCEVCAHHLLFDVDTFPTAYASYANVNPPLRTADDREVLYDALKRGAIDALATDHAPHLPSEKERGASGYPGLDIYGPLTTLLLRDLPLDVVLSVTSGFAAQLWRRFAGETFGAIAPGAVGSLTVLGPEPWQGVRRESFTTKCGWSPYVGYVFPGAVQATIVRGRIAYLRPTWPGTAT